MREEKVITHRYQREKIFDLQKLLDGDLPNNQDNVIETFSANFGKGIEVDVKVVGIPDSYELAGQSYVDAVFFHDGAEVTALEVSEEIIGDFHLYYKGVDYTFRILPFEE